MSNTPSLPSDADMSSKNQLPSAPANMNHFQPIQASIEKVEASIEKVERDIEKAEKAGDRKKEEQLRKKEEQLRKEKEQLREKELLLLKRSASHNEPPTRAGFGGKRRHLERKDDDDVEMVALPELGWKRQLHRETFSWYFDHSPEGEAFAKALTEAEPETIEVPGLHTDAEGDEKMDIDGEQNSSSIQLYRIGTPFPGFNMIHEQNLLVRPEMQNILDQVEGVYTTINSPNPASVISKAVILGGPGIGKSFSGLNAYLRMCLLKHRNVVFESRREEKVYLYVYENGKYTCWTSPEPQSVLNDFVIPLLADTRTVFLVDPYQGNQKNPKILRAMTVFASSPNVEHYKGLAKNNCLFLVLPIWTKEQCWAVRDVINHPSMPTDPEAFAEAFADRYFHVGGMVRYLFGETKVYDEFLAGMRNKVKEQAGIVLESQLSWDNPAFSHHLFAVHCNPPYERKNSYNDVLSAYAYELIANLYHTRFRLKDMRGQLIESHFLHILSLGGTFPCVGAAHEFKQTDNDVRVTKITLGEEFDSTFEFDNVIWNRDGAAYDDEMEALTHDYKLVICPTNYPNIDAAESRTRGYQATKSASHHILAKLMLEILKQLKPGELYELNFLVPLSILKTFRHYWKWEGVDTKKDKLTLLKRVRIVYVGVDSIRVLRRMQLKHAAEH